MVDQKNVVPSPKTAKQLTVNLLPPEILLQRRANSKLSMVNKLSIVALLVLVFFTSATFALRISQGRELQVAQDGVAEAESQVTTFKDTEGQLFVLKDRLNTIASLATGDTKRRAIFNTVVSLTPAEIQISDLSIDRAGVIMVSFVSPTLSALETLIANLSSKEKSVNLISKVNLEGLAIGKDYIYRGALKIIPN